jgi:hypothetical protein
MKDSEIQPENVQVEESKDQSNLNSTEEKPAEPTEPCQSTNN